MAVPFLEERGAERMRRLMWFTIGFAAACGAGVYLVSGIWLFALAVCCLICVPAMYLLRSVKAKITALVLLGMMCGFVWLGIYDACYLDAARQMDSKEAAVRIQVTDYGYDTDYGVAADGTLELEGKTYKTRFYLNSKVALAPGDTVSGNFRLRYTADGGQQEPTTHQGSGTFLLAYGRSDIIITRTYEVPAKYFAAALRSGILALLDEMFPADTLAFARALLLGDSSLLSYEQDVAFQRTGLRHVIAVSGLHVSILFSLVYLFSGRRRVLTVVLGIPALVLFAALAGFTPSIVRACVMQGLMLLALLLDKEYDPPTALGFAVLVMLLVNPLTVTSISLQLSVGCMIGMFLFSERIRRYLLSDRCFGQAKGKDLKARLLRWLASSVSATVSALITTTPLCAYYFGCVSLVGIAANLLTLWVISYIFYGIMAACILGALWVPLGRGIAWLISWPIRYVLGTTQFLSDIPLAAVYTDSFYICAWLVFTYVLLAVFLRCRPRKPLLYCACTTAVLCIALLLSWLVPRFEGYRMTVLDVGQGQCILLQSRGRAYMVDCGGDYPQDAANLAAQTLLSQGITRLDGLIITHYDRDHADGAELFLSRIPADTLYLPDVPDERGVRERLENAYPEQVCLVDSDTVISYEDVKLSIFAAKEGISGNESALCVLFQPGNCDILITSDRSMTGERALLAAQELPRLEILVAGHHGSKDATSLELLEATRPAVTVISVSANNRYGHPSSEVLQRLHMIGSQVVRTDIHGNCIFWG